MGDPDVPEHVVADVHAEPGGLIAWTGRTPTFRFRIGSANKLVLAMRYGVNDRTFRDTGPVTLTIKVNGQQIDRFRKDAPGGYLYEHAVPPALIHADAELNVSIEVDPVWMAPDDKAELGIRLEAIGFYQP
jgi:hypothetical protein